MYVYGEHDYNLTTSTGDASLSLAHSIVIGHVEKSTGCFNQNRQNITK